MVYLLRLASCTPAIYLPTNFSRHHLYATKTPVFICHFNTRSRLLVLLLISLEPSRTGHSLLLVFRVFSLKLKKRTKKIVNFQSGQDCQKIAMPRYYSPPASTLSTSLTFNPVFRNIRHLLLALCVDKPLWPLPQWLRNRFAFCATLPWSKAQALSRIRNGHVWCSPVELDKKAAIV